jgi:hypothetical protein
LIKLFLDLDNDKLGLKLVDTNQWSLNCFLLIIIVSL